MIVNFIGPPCAGKSYVASRYTLEHPSWGYVSIDACRVEQADENKAWGLLERKLRATDLAILESSGLSWRLPGILARQDREILTLCLLAQREVLHERLEKRQFKRKIPYRLRMDEAQAIDWVLQNLDECEYPVAQFIRTDEISKEELYSLVSEKIAERRLEIANKEKTENVI